MLYKMFLPALLIAAICTFASPGDCQSVRVTVDATHRGQTWEGWGATDLFSFDGLEVEQEAGAPGKISTEARKSILQLYYQELGMNRVRFWPMGYEPTIGTFVWEGRGTRPVNSVNPFCDDHLVLGSAFRNPKEPFVFYPSAHQWESWMATKPDSERWMWGGDAIFNPAQVDAYAAHVVAAVRHVEEIYHYAIPYWSLFNEPANTAHPSKETTLALVLATGRRLKQARLGTKLAICDDVTPEASAATIEYVLANPEARQYVGAVSYHRYCGDYVLEQVKPMLCKVATGELLVSTPVSFYASAHRYGKSVWLSEQCSYGDEGITLFDAGRARANHICDEINHGKVNAFDFMLPYFIERGRPGNEEAPIFLRFKDKQFARAEINSFGSWISHFTRYIRPGAVQLDARVADPVIKAVAFRQPTSRELALVVINNRPEPREMALSLVGTCATGAVKRLRTTPASERSQLASLLFEGSLLKDTLPGKSVTTYTMTTR